MDLVEPKADDFFATARGVCVYINVGRRSAVRVQFVSPDAPAAIDGDDQTGEQEAVAVATRAFEAHKHRLVPLFERIAHELAARS
jgi:hypothetical protein